MHLSKKEVYFYFYSSNEPQYFEQVCYVEFVWAEFKQSVIDSDG